MPASTWQGALSHPFLFPFPSPNRPAWEKQRLVRPRGLAGPEWLGLAGHPCGHCLDSALFGAGVCKRCGLSWPAPPWSSSTHGLRLLPSPLSWSTSLTSVSTCSKTFYGSLFSQTEVGAGLSLKALCDQEATCPAQASFWEHSAVHTLSPTQRELPTEVLAWPVSRYLKPQMCANPRLLLAMQR